jgi:hypothetical protein
MCQYVHVAQAVFASFSTLLQQGTEDVNSSVSVLQKRLYLPPPPTHNYIHRQTVAFG